MASRKFNYNIGFIGIQFPGTSAGSVSITAQSSGGSYNFNLPTSSGSTGQVLLSGGGGTSPMTWGSSQLNLSSRFLNSAFSLPTGTATIIPFEGIDTPNSLGVTGLSYSAGTFTNTLSTPIQLMLTVSVNFIGSNAGYRNLYIQDSTGQIYGNVEQLANLNNSETGLSTSAQFVVGVGESFGVYVFQNSGSSMTLESGTSGNTKIQMTSMMSIPTGATINATVTSNTLGSLITTTSGNVGINTTSNITNNLEVNGTVAFNVMPAFQTSGVIQLGRADGVDRSSTITVYNDTSTNSYMSFDIHNGTLGSRTTRMLIDGSGNVGIRTTNPTTALHISGGHLLATGNQTTRLIVQNSSTGSSLTTSGMQLVHDGTRGFVCNYENNPMSFIVNGNFTRMTLNTSGNLGIGTTTPGYTLDVNGTLEASNSNGLMLFASSGNVGIATTNPSYLLDVNGSARMESINFTSTSLNLTKMSGISRVAITNIATTTNTSNIFQLYMYGVPGASEQANLEIKSLTSGNYRINSMQSGSQALYPISLSINNNDYLTLSTTGNVGIATTSPVGTLDVRDATNFVGDDGGALYITGGTNGNRRLHMGYHNTNNYGWIEVVEKGVDLRGLILQPRAGNVGIGTTNPNYKLDVIGDININSTDGNQAGYITTSKEPTFNNKMVIQAARGVGGILFNLVNEGNIMAIVPGTNTAGNVGIGTTSPSEKLHIAGGNLLIDRNSNANTTLGTIRLVGSAGLTYFQSGLQSINDSKADIRFTSINGVSTWMTIRTSGNVGIGTTNPTNTLSVLGSGSGGTIRVYSNTYRGETSIGFYENTTSGNIWVVGMGGWSSGTNLVLGNTGFGNPIMSLTTAGNVGIGTTAPTSRLYITDTSTSPFALIIDGTGKTVNNGININAATGYIPFINFQVNGNGPNIAATSTQLQITQSASNTTSINPNGGNVGINTTSPSTSLHVNGAITHGGGYAVLGLSVGTYAAGTSVLQFGSTQFSSRITNNTSSFTFQDAGIFMIHVKLNSDTAVTSNIQAACQYFDGTNWINYQYSEDSRAYNGAVEFVTHFMVQASANQQWRISLNNQSGANWTFSTDTSGGTWWSRLMIYKVA